MEAYRETFQQTVDVIWDSVLTNRCHYLQSIDLIEYCSLEDISTDQWIKIKVRIAIVRWVSHSTSAALVQALYRPIRGLSLSPSTWR